MPAQRTKVTWENFVGVPRELEYNTIYRRASSCPPESRFGKVKIEGPPSFVSRYEPYDKRTFALVKKHNHDMVHQTNVIEQKLTRHVVANNGNNKIIRRKLEKLNEIESSQTDLINLNAQLFGEMEMNTFNIQDMMGSMQALVMKVNRIENGVRDLRELVEEDYRSEDHPESEEAEQDLPAYIGNRADEEIVNEREETESSNGLTESELGRYREESRYYNFEIPTVETLLADRAGISSPIGSPVAGPSRLPLEGSTSNTLVEITEGFLSMTERLERYNNNFGLPPPTSEVEDSNNDSDRSYYTPKPEVIDLTNDDDIALPGSIGNTYVDYHDGPPRRAPSSRAPQDDDVIPFQCTVPSER
jgi:hypothetical protein